MKKGDFLWIILFILITSVFIIPVSRSVVESFTINHPYLSGFIKTSVLASMGELLVERIKSNKYVFSMKTVYKFIVWGFLGMSFVLVFKLFFGGVVSAQAAGYLPSIVGDSFGSKLLTAFLTSLLMNLIFAPTFMILHRITDSYIDLGEGCIKKIVSVRLGQIIDHINWKFFFGFVILQTIPLFWIPAHTITFLLPEAYRVLMAAYLSVALGMILTISNVFPTKVKM